MNIKKIIKEEIDDFNWIRDLETNIWFSNDYVLIDVEPLEQNINSLIDLAFDSGRINDHSKKSWGMSIDDDINQILQYFYGYGKSYLRINEAGSLMYGYDLEPMGRWIKYSNIF